jgi:site-specific DNA recombinase
MKRLTRALAEADVEITAAKTANHDVETTLAEALQAAGRCQVAYLTAPNPIRRQINQGFFKKLFIGEDGTVERAELTEPFAALLGQAETVDTYVTATPEDAPTTPHGVPDAPEPTDDATDATRPSHVFTAMYGDQGEITESTRTKTHRTLIHTVQGLKQRDVVGAVGIEPTTKWL